MGAHEDGRQLRLATRYGCDQIAPLELSFSEHVDTHVERVSKRLGLVPLKMAAAKTHDALEAQLEPDEVYAFHVDLIQHGRRTCHARSPGCDSCVLEPRCPRVEL